MSYSDPVRIRGLLRSYQWGSTTRFQELVGINSSQPLAELWFSCDADGFSAQEALQLGSTVAPSADRKAEELIFPFKAKLLAIASTLSIQVHPDDTVSARYCQNPRPAFSSVTSPLGKFETLLALEPLELVAGPADPDQVEALLPFSIHGELAYRRRYESDPHEAFVALLRRIEVASAAEVAQFERLLEQPCPQYQVLTAHLRQAWQRFAGDALVMGLAAMQHRSLQAGQRVHIRPGVAHCYLSGLGLEITAGSENIARFGLTDKPVNRALFYESLRAERPTFGGGCCVQGIDVEIGEAATPRPDYHQLWIPFGAGSRIEIGNAEVILPGEALLIPSGAKVAGFAIHGCVGAVSWCQHTR